MVKFSKRGIALLIISVFTFLSFSFGSLAHANPMCQQLFSDTKTSVNGLSSSYRNFEQILVENKNAILLNSTAPLIATAYGTEVPIVHSFEAEGLQLKNIREWFSNVKPSFKANLKKQFEADLLRPANQQKFLKWLAAVKLRTDRMSDDMVDWGALNLAARLEYLLSVENPLSLLTNSQADELFETRAVTYDDITVNAKAPAGITVGDDGGSWEVRSKMGQVNRADYLQLRSQVEGFLDQRIGHQHLFHSWPENTTLRKEMAPYYIEVLDTTTWYLFWRQMKRTDTDEEERTVVDHPYLGVYSTNSLARLQSAVEDNRPDKFHDKYRLVGARNFPASEEIPEQSGDVPDWEIRSGNKGVMREFVEASAESRLVTGDYRGLRAFGSYRFDTQASVRELTQNFLNTTEIELLERFEQTFPMMKWSQRANAKNNYRTKIISPLFPWENRFDLNYKMQIYKKAQKQYAKALVEVANDFFKSVAEGTPTRTQSLDQRRRSLAKIKLALRSFANTVRLDLDGEMYLRPRAEEANVPTIQVPSSGPIDVNKVDLGIEYSMRLPLNMNFQSVADAQRGILGLATRFSEKNGFHSPVPYQQDGHGHGIAVKYTVLDAGDANWRFEWDGIQREYKEGQVVKAFNGHIEIVTPKFSPQSIQGTVQNLYREGRSMGLLPRRNAGGAHINFDLAPLKALAPELGTRALLNLISYFESERELILFLWQHPKRSHAAFPVVRTPEMAENFKNFNGGWRDLGRMLYDVKYFNPYVGRKPKYVPLNLTAVMTSILPPEYYEKSLDIKNKEQKWFPNFAKVFSRGEARFFDAPTDEHMAALHIKYFRALMQKTFNSEQPLDLKIKYNAKRVQKWKSDPATWIEDAEKHLEELGLDVTEFRSLLWDSYMNQVSNESRKVDYQVYRNFLPAKTN